MNLLWGCRGGDAHPLALARGGGGCYFHDKAEKYERHINGIRVIVMICHTVSEYHV